MSDLLEQAAIKDFFTQNLQIIYIEKKFDLCCHQDSSAQIHQQEVRWSILIEMSGFFSIILQFEYSAHPHILRRA